MRGNKVCSGAFIAMATAMSVLLGLTGMSQAKDAEKTTEVKTPATKTPATKTTAANSKTTVSKTAKVSAKGKITEQRAVDLVMQMPEVKQFFKDVANSKVAKPTIDMDRKEGDAYVVHVYEVVNDGPSSSHTATKNWYYVNIKTGKITKEF